MTTSRADQAMPLIMCRAVPTIDLAEQHKHYFGALEEATPIPVERRRDGVIVSRDTLSTEVVMETTDDV
ncbi:hypothetical protein [Luteibacter sp. UNCMF366Tsu5.1]|uniref:hypothetical protein n=1 Tax=Luteibacter sp. UNCMF366Tsu5.1 TaxID=1502758 RepID=UPI0009089262|nr:hypothetical protein [Luteibacter sp. UNCMF366Tsu5.1]SFW59978.1 hypothetical protein SAMN02800691_2452 [Luteibacter sp. UNCMF366Tsu5.1]